MRKALSILLIFNIFLYSNYCFSMQKKLQKKLAAKKADSSLAEVINCFSKSIEIFCLYLTNEEIRTKYFNANLQESNGKAKYFVRIPMSDEALRLIVKDNHYTVSTDTNKTSIISINNFPLDLVTKLYKTDPSTAIELTLLSLGDKLFQSFRQNELLQSNDALSAQQANLVKACRCALFSQDEKLRQIVMDIRELIKEHAAGVALEKNNNGAASMFSCSQYDKQYIQSSFEFFTKIINQNNNEIALESTKKNYKTISEFLSGDLYKEKISSLLLKHKALASECIVSISNSINGAQNTKKKRVRKNKKQSPLSEKQETPNINLAQKEIASANNINNNIVVDNRLTSTSVDMAIKKITQDRFNETIVSVTDNIMSCKNQHGDLCTIFNLGKGTLKELLDQKQQDTIIYDNRVTRWWKATPEECAQNSQYSYHSHPRCFVALFAPWGMLSQYRKSNDTLYFIGKLRQKNSLAVEYSKYVTGFILHTQANADQPSKKVYHQFTKKYGTCYDLIADSKNEETTKAILDEEFPKLRSSAK
jgi:hypothetical protein